MNTIKHLCGPPSSSKAERSSQPHNPPQYSKSLIQSTHHVNIWITNCTSVEDEGTVGLRT